MQGPWSERPVVGLDVRVQLPDQRVVPPGADAGVEPGVEPGGHGVDNPNAASDGQEDD